MQSDYVAIPVATVEQVRDALFNAAFRGPGILVKLPQALAALAALDAALTAAQAAGLMDTLRVVAAEQSTSIEELEQKAQAFEAWHQAQAAGGVERLDDPETEDATPILFAPQRTVPFTFLHRAQYNRLRAIVEAARAAYDAHMDQSGGWVFGRFSDRDECAFHPDCWRPNHAPDCPWLRLDAALERETTG